MKSLTSFSLRDWFASTGLYAPIFVFLLTAGSAAGAEATRVIVTTFALPAKSELLDDYNKAELARCRSKVADRLAELGRTHFNYFVWQPEDTGTSGSAPAASLVVTLAETSRTFGNVVTLTISGQIGGKKSALEYTLTPALYAETDLDKPTQHPDRLIGDVIKRLEAEFRSGAFRDDELQAKFLANIPVALAVELEPPTIVVPINADVLRAGENSKLKVEYSTPTARAFLSLCPAMIEKWQAPTKCLVSHFQWLPIETHGYGPDVLNSFNQRDPNSVQVYVAHYLPDYRVPSQDAKSRDTKPNQ